MPFQSEKQRRYLWANEPEIARDWTNKYGSRVKKYDGGIMDTFIGNLYNRDKISNLEAQYGAGATGLPSDARHMAAMNELSKTLSPGIVPEWAGDVGAFGAGLINEIPAAFKGLGAKNRAAIMEDIKANWAGTFGTSQKTTPEQIYASVYNKGIPTQKKSFNYGTAQAAIPDEITSDQIASRMANLDKFTPRVPRNVTVAQQQDDEDNPYDFTDRLRRRKDFTTKYPSYNAWQMRGAQAPGWKRNIGRMMDFLRGPGTRLTPAQQRANQSYMTQQRITRDPQTGRMQGGLFAGQNAPGTSFFGSKTFPEMAQKWALKNQQRQYTTPKMQQKQRDIISVATGGRDPSQGNTVTGHGTSGMGRDPSDRMARGGLASLWPR